MAKVYFNYSNLNVKIIPSLDSTINSFRSVIDCSRSLNIPGDFRYASDLRNLTSFFEGKRDELIYIKDWLNKSNKNYEESLNQVNDILLDIDQRQIQKRERVVK